MGSDCMSQPFSETHAKFKNDPDSYFIKGEVVDIVQNGNKIKIIQDFKENFAGDTVIIPKCPLEYSWLIINICHSIFSNGRH
jgi:hypothetical protein